MAVIMGNRIYIAVKLNEATDPYMFIRSINKQLPISGIFIGLTEITLEFTTSRLLTLVRDSGFIFLETAPSNQILYFKCEKVYNL